MTSGTPHRDRQPRLRRPSPVPAGVGAVAAAVGRGPVSPAVTEMVAGAARRVGTLRWDAVRQGGAR